VVVRRRKSKRPYPHNKDIVEAMRKVLVESPWVPPLDFVDRVKEELRREGFYVGLVNARRIWRLYEEQVRRKLMPDVLNVISRGDSYNRESTE